MWAERQPLDVSERLCRLASQLAGIAGIAMLDLGDHRLARSLFRTARTAADETGDRKLRAWVAVRESLVPLYFGDPREAADLAAAAADLAGRQPCAAAVMAPVVRARAQARLISRGQSGRRVALERTRASLDRALDALADLPADQRADTALGYTERQLHFHAGDILVTLGDWQAAHRAFGQADELYGSTEVLDRALVAFGHAQCLLAADEPDQALGLGRDVLTGLPAEHRTAVIMQVARSLGRDAGRRDGRLPALAGYREALHSA
jgi:tetratricopeptide (TPR) repeat protein